MVILDNFYSLLASSQTGEQRMFKVGYITYFGYENTIIFFQCQEISIIYNNSFTFEHINAYSI